LFKVELRVNNRALATGEGPAIKVAHQEAARVAIEETGRESAFDNN